WCRAYTPSLSNTRSTYGCASTSDGSALTWEPTKQVIVSGYAALSSAAHAVLPIMLVVPEFGFWPYTTKQTRRGLASAIRCTACAWLSRSAVQSRMPTPYPLARQLCARSRLQVGGSTAEKSFVRTL